MPKVFSMQECYNWKTTGKQSETKAKVEINNNERILKFAFLNQLDNLANALAVRRDAFDLLNTCDFNHSTALSLLTLRYFKNRIKKICDNLQGNLNRWNRAWDQCIKEKAKQDNPVANQRSCLNKLE